MNWGKAKSFIIAILALVNVFLGAFIYLQGNQYRLNAAQVSNIKTVLANANIGIQTPVPVGYAPMRQISLADCDYDTDMLVSLFFQYPDEVERSDEPNKTVYRWNDAALSIQSDGYIALDNPYGAGQLQSFDEDSARGLCAAFVDTMSKSMPGLKYDGAVYEADTDGYRITYRQSYKNTVVYTNFVAFLVTQAGITQMDCFYGKPAGYVGAAMEICSPDVALLDFAERITGFYGNQAYNISITQIDIVYMQESGGSQGGVSLRATPYYRVIFTDGPDEREIDIDAYGTGR